VTKRWRMLGTLGLAILLAWRLDRTALASALSGAHAGWWLAAVGVFLLAQAVSSWRWQMLAGALGCGGPYHRYLGHYFIGMFFNLVLPTSVGGDVVRGWYLGKAESRRGPAYLSVLADRASGLMVLVVLACLAALCCPTPLAPWLTWIVAGLGFGVVAGTLSLPLLPRLPLPEKAARLVEASLVSLGTFSLLASATALSAVVQGANVIVVWLIGLGMGVEIPLAYYGVFVPLVALLTLLPISLNGMGLREVGTVALLGPLGVPAETAVTLAVLQFAAYSAAGLVGGGVYLMGRFPRFGTLAGSSANGPGAGVEVPSDAESVGGYPDQGRTRKPPAAA
jgi:uncharacterized membrane protein YbhN (UPF0104 family)